jgi:hypothetical protein
MPAGRPKNREIEQDFQYYQGSRHWQAIWRVQACGYRRTYHSSHLARHSRSCPKKSQNDIRDTITPAANRFSSPISLDGQNQPISTYFQSITPCNGLDRGH